MHRIDTSTAQKDKFGAGKNGFTLGNAQTGVPPTEVSEYILDALQEEICSVIEDVDSGLILDKNDNSQLLLAIKKIISKKALKPATLEEVITAVIDSVYVPPKYMPAVISRYAPVSGGYRNLRLRADGASSNVSITADQIVLDELGFLGHMIADSVNITANAASVGLNGLDAGVLSPNTWYSVWVISNGTNVASLLSLSAKSPTMPDGYTHRRRVGWIRTDATANKYPLRFSQNGDAVTCRIAAGSNMTSNIVMATGVQGAVSGTGVTVALGGFIPQTADEVRVVLSTQTATGGVVQVGLHGSLLESVELSVSGSVNQAQQANIQLEPGSSSIVFASNITLGVMYLRGWRDSL